MPTSRAPAPAVSALSAIAPSPPARPPRRAAPSPPPPRGSEAAILYNKGDAAGLAALAQAANDAAGRSALEWASLRANAHPSFAALAAFLEAHPTWPSRGWIRERAGSRTGRASRGSGEGRRVFRRRPPQTSAGKIAAARAAKAMGRSDEAAQIIRALWRDGNFDALTESVILRDFGASLHKGRSQISRRPPDLRRLRRRRLRAPRRLPVPTFWRWPRLASRPLARRMSAGASEGGSPGAPRRSWPVVFQGPVRPSRRPRL